MEVKAACRRISLQVFADLELIDSPIGNFGALFTLFPKKPLKNGGNKRNRERKTKLFTGTCSICLEPCKMTEGPGTAGLLYIP